MPMQDGKGLLSVNFLFQKMFKMLDNFWCVEMSLPKKAISSSCFGEY